ncbi:MAG: MFS transporter [Candidatus Izimaplasma sp.]|nr:MFS transporter [Candidatus Izimaplasma bacterium]
MKRAVIVVISLNFMQGIIHNLGHPVTPRLVTNMGIPDYMFGLFFALMSLGLVLGSPLWGTLGDRGKKANYMALGLLVYSIGQFGFGFANNMYLMSFFRFLSGFGVSASITLMVSHIIEHTVPEKRSLYLAWHAAVFVAGSSIGYFIGGFIYESPFFNNLLQTNQIENIFLIQAIINVFHAGLMYTLITLDDNVEHETRHKTAIEHITNIKYLDKNLIIFLISLTLISLGAINVSKYIEVYMNHIGYGPQAIGTFVFVTGMVSLFANAVITPLLALLKRDFTLMILIQLLSAIIIFIVFRMDAFIIAIYSLFMGYVVLKAVYTPLEQHFISLFAKPGEYGQVMGVRQSFFSIGMVLGPLLGGFIYNYRKMWVFDFSAIMFLLGLALLLIIGRNMKHNRNLDTVQTQ